MLLQTITLDKTLPFYVCRVFESPLRQTSNNKVVPFGRASHCIVYVCVCACPNLANLHWCNKQMAPVTYIDAEYNINVQNIALKPVLVLLYNQTLMIFSRKGFCSRCPPLPLSIGTVE